MTKIRIFDITEMHSRRPDAAVDVSGTGTGRLLRSFTRKPRRMKKGVPLKSKNVRNATEHIVIH